MAEKEVQVCAQCGTPFVPAKEETQFNGMPGDGTWNFDNMVCPHCHPELVAH